MFICPFQRIIFGTMLLLALANLKDLSKLTINIVPKAKPAKKRKSNEIHKKVKQDISSSSFPTNTKMKASREISLENIPQDEVYESMKAERRNEQFKGNHR